MSNASTSLPAIVQIGDPVLRSLASEVPSHQIGSADLQALFRLMIQVMRAAPGVGLAAPQIGVPLRVIVLEDRDDLMVRLSPEERDERERFAFDTRVIVNPILTPVGEDRVTFFEGCLSVAGYAGLVERHRTVEVTGLDEHARHVEWRVTGWPARILQHEVDHILGTVYVDRMLTRSFSTVQHASARFGAKSSSEIRRLLGV